VEGEERGKENASWMGLRSTKPCKARKEKKMSRWERGREKR